MGFHMCLQSVLFPELSIAHLAPEWFGARVDEEVVLEQAVPLERLAAHIAYVGSFAGVDFKMII